ncbi:uncharacterized protein LOC112690045 isoform X2 [Sipha flava]|uniref:Uncharacterized protein LOC112690045 isoform X2 n=1 Tax=Sipha flava TaxID=143950 RepID=A0A8B8GAC4_9HEMI|nr:uncharacterized protein LOC112690045 isoform X2 [Sipha flava]
MNKISIVILMAVAVCSCYGVPGQRNIRSASELSAETGSITDRVTSPEDLVAAESTDVFTARAKKGGGGGHKNKYEAMHMGLNYVKMVISTLMAAIGHVLAFKGVGLALISVLIQVAQLIMTLKKSKDSHPPSYKIIETPWHTTPTESFGSYGGHGSYGGQSAYGGQGAQSSYSARRRR